VGDASVSCRFDSNRDDFKKSTSRRSLSVVWKSCGFDDGSME
jgi:hypothetical protein